MVVRELLARIGVQIDQKSISRADAAIAGLKKSLAALGVGYAAKKAYDFVSGQFEQIAATADELGRLSQQTGIAVEQLQALQFAARMADVDSGELKMALVHLSRSAQEAATQGGTAGAAFYRLGIAVKDGSGHLKPTNVLLGEMADKFARMPDGPEKAALAVDLLSRSGADLIPLLNGGSAGLEKMGAEARKAGVIMSGGLVKQGQALDDNLKLLHATLQGLSIAILGPFVGSVVKATKAFAAWVSTHRQIIALRIDQVVLGIAHALQQAAEMANRFRGVALLLGVILGATFAPVTTTLLGLLLIFEDLYGYTHGKKSAFGLLAKELELFALKLDLVWKRFADDPFGQIRKAAETFFDWFVEEAKKIPERITGGQTKPGGGLLGPLDKLLSVNGSFAIGNGKAVPFSLMNPGLAMLDPLSAVMRMIGTGKAAATSIGNINLTINAPGGDGPSIVKAFEDYLSNLLASSAQ